jgi:DNA-binding NtrC family response regulator
MKPLIMFVDDDPMLLASINRQLARKLTAFDFVLCDRGAKALDEAAKRTPHVLFSDMRMPEMDGLTFLSEFVKRHPSTICFALTGQLAAAELAQMETLVRQILAKPIDFTILRELIESSIPSTDAT